MFLTSFEAVVASLLKGALHNVDLQEIPDFLPEEDLLLHFNWVSKALVLGDLLPGLEAALVKHAVIPHEGLHHGLQQSPVEHQGRLMNELAHLY